MKFMIAHKNLFKIIFLIFIIGIIAFFSQELIANYYEKINFNQIEVPVKGSRVAKYHLLFKTEYCLIQFRMH